jgi:hypothetical protein
MSVAGHDDTQRVVREGQLGERGDDGGVDAARQAEDRAAPVACDLAGLVDQVFGQIRPDRSSRSA